MMNLRNVTIICSKELTEIRRDKRSLVMALLAPLVVSPIIGFMFVLMRQDATMSTMLLSGLFQLIALFAINLVGYIGLDMTAGEKERNTLETTLTMYSTREEIVWGKYLALTTTSLVAAVTTFTCVAAAYLVSTIIVPSERTSAVSGLILKGTVSFALFAVYYSTLFSALILVVGLASRNMKQASMLHNLFYLVTVAAPMMSVVFGLPLSIGVAFLPAVNCNLICNKILTSSVAPMYLVILLFTLVVYTSGAILFAISLIKRDAVLSRT